MTRLRSAFQAARQLLLKAIWGESV